MKRCVVVGGADINNYEYIRGCLREDDYSEMEIVSKEPAFIEDSFAYFSLINVSGKAKGIVVENAKYSLDNAEITCEYQYGISNEVMKGEIAKVSVSDGQLLLVRVFEK